MLERLRKETMSMSSEESLRQEIVDGQVYVNDLKDGGDKFAGDTVPVSVAIDVIENFDDTNKIRVLDLKSQIEHQKELDVDEDCIECLNECEYCIRLEEECDLFFSRSSYEKFASRCCDFILDSHLTRA